MKNIAIIILITVLCGCKSKYAYEHPVKIIYSAPYKKKSLISYPFLNNSENAIKLGLTFLSTYYYKQNIDFQIYNSITATLVNKNDIWKVKMIKHEIIGNQEELIQYFVYIRKVDGALLYIQREVGEWIGSTDLEERPIKN